MSSNTGINITSYLFGNKNQTKNVKLPTGNFNRAITDIKTDINSSIWSNSIRIITYILSILVVLLVILLFIHFFIKPIFRLRPGAPGIIPVPGFDDGKLYWNKTNPGQILNSALPIEAIYADYSMTLDIFIENPLQFSTTPRVLLSRGAVRKERPEGDTLMGMFNYYNLVIGLLPDTNDLIVSTLNKNNNMENVIIPNIPIQEPFKLGVILMENALEVYMNGHLIKTRTFSVPLQHVTGDIYPSAGVEANMAKVRNLKIWPRILSTSEIRDSTPSLSSTKDFDAGQIPSSTSCATKIESNIEQRMSKLSIDTVSPHRDSSYIELE
jgi:hypothetical protein